MGASGDDGVAYANGELGGRPKSRGKWNGVKEKKRPCYTY